MARIVLLPVVRISYRWYRRSDRTPAIGYSAMRKLFTSAHAHRLAGLSHGEETETGPSSGDAVGIIADDRQDVVDTLRRDGVRILESTLSEATCQRLEELARKTPCHRVAPLHDGPDVARFEPNDPTAARYDLPESALVADPTVQEIMADQSVLAIAWDYLGARPVLDLVAMWWTAATERSFSVAAQEFHFDLDRLRFLKLFVYLTDVDQRTGPHVYVRGSHLGTPLVRHGDRRYRDDDVIRAHGLESVETITGPRGTIFLADTRGLHKGLPVDSGHRLVFQLEFASSLFGAPYARHTIVSPAPALREAAATHLRTYRRFSFVED